MRKLIFIIMACVLFGIVSCTPDEEYTFPTESSKDSADYAPAFKAKFGESTSFNTVKTVKD